MHKQQIVSGVQGTVPISASLGDVHRNCALGLYMYEKGINAKKPIFFFNVSTLHCKVYTNYIIA